MSGLILHHLQNSRSHRIGWMLEEMGLDYELRYYPRQPSMAAPEALKAVHPLGKSPVLEEDGAVYAESGAIIEHLLDRPEAAALRPAHGEALDRFRYWMHFAEGSMMTPILVRFFLSRVPDVPAELADRVASQLETTFGFCESGLAAGDWFAGETFSAADIQMSYPVQVATRIGLDARYPALMAWLDRIAARPAYRAAEARVAAAESSDR